MTTTQMAAPETLNSSGDAFYERQDEDSHANDKVSDKWCLNSLSDY